MKCKGHPVLTVTQDNVAQFLKFRKVVRQARSLVLIFHLLRSLIQDAYKRLAAAQRFAGL